MRSASAGQLPRETLESRSKSAGRSTAGMRLPRCHCRPYLLLSCLCATAGFCCLLFAGPLGRSPDVARDSSDGSTSHLPCTPMRHHWQAPAEAASVSLSSLAVLDGSQQYRVWQFAWVGDRWRQAAQAGGAWTPCLALHASLSHAHHVQQHAHAWSGPLSVALFAAGDDVHLLLSYIAFLRRCSHHVRDRVSFHLVWPSDLPPNETLSRGWDVLADADCSEGGEQALQRLVSRQWRPVGDRLSYPQNLARNTARLACPTRLALCPDADMLPGRGTDLAAGLAGLFTREPPCQRCAYVLPVFEVDSSVSVPPADKWELRQLVDKGLARPFHWGIFKANQQPLDPQRWLKHGNASSTQMSVAYEIKYGWAFEPIYVAASGELPLFDESFIGYGFTRNTQAYEMFAANWRFLVLDHAFLIHRGLQSMKKRPKWRWKENSRNNGRFLKWSNRVALKYDLDPMNLTWKYADFAAGMMTCPREKCESARPKPTKSPASTKKQGDKA